MADLPQHQKDIRWLFAHAKSQNLPPPTSDQATAFAERVAIMIFEAGLSEREARLEAANPILEELRHAQNH